jgi:hypothetical protein
MSRSSFLKIKFTTQSIVQQTLKYYNNIELGLRAVARSEREL